MSGAEGDRAVLTSPPDASAIVRGPRHLARCPRCWELYWIKQMDTTTWHIWHATCVGNAQPCIIRIGTPPVCTRYTCWGVDAPALDTVDLEASA